jgi:IS5 family transposase
MTVSPRSRLKRAGRQAKKLLGDKAYDSAELRQWLEDRGTKAIIPNSRRAASDGGSWQAGRASR